MYLLFIVHSYRKHLDKARKVAIGCPAFANSADAQERGHSIDTNLILAYKGL